MNPSHKPRRFLALIAVTALATLTSWNSACGTEEPVASADKSDRILIAGDDIVWTVRQTGGEKDAKFDLIVRTPSGKWVTLGRFTGRPAAVAARKRQLHVISKESRAYVFSLSDDAKQMRLIGGGPRPGARWTENAPPAAIFAAPALGKSNSPCLIAAVAFESDKLSTRPASQPAGKRSGLTILQTVKSQWIKLSKINNIPGAKDARVSIAAVDQWMYVLIVAKDDPPRLMALDVKDKKAVWKDITIPTSPRQPLAVSVLRTQPILLTIAQANQTAASQPDRPTISGITLHIREIQGDKLAEKSRIITAQDGELTLPSNSAPHVCAVGKANESQLALLWKDAGVFQFALADLNGTVAENKKVDELTKAKPLIDIDKISDYIFPAIMIAMLLFVVLGRRNRAAGPMVLPAQFVPASISNRLVAAVIDGTPFFLTGLMVLFSIRPDLATEFQTMPRQGQEMSIEMRLWMLGSSLAWFIYGSIMEAKYGATLGKMAMKIETVSADGKKLTVSQALARNFIRVVEVMFVIILFTLAIVLITRTHQRIGDLMARTVVVAKTRTATPDNPTDTQDEPPKDI